MLGRLAPLAQRLRGRGYRHYYDVDGLYVYRHDAQGPDGDLRIRLLMFRGDPEAVDEEAEELAKIGELWLRELEYWEARGWSGRLPAPRGEPTLRVVWVETDTRYRREGFGTRLYEVAAQVACELGLPLSSDLGERRSEFSEGFWAKQVHLRRAKLCNPERSAVSIFLARDPCRIASSGGGFGGLGALSAEEVDAGLVELYHVTYEGNLDGIGAEGLDPQASGVFACTRYAAHSEGRVFLTEADGITFWYGIFERHAEHHAEDVLEEQMVPVVLRVRIPLSELRYDELGTRDSMADAHFTTKRIEPEDLELWDGSDWVDPSDGVDPELALQWIEDEDFEEGGFWQFKDYDNSLEVPDVERPWYED